MSLDLRLIKALSDAFYAEANDMNPMSESATYSVEAAIQDALLDAGDALRALIDELDGSPNG